MKSVLLFKTLFSRYQSYFNKTLLLLLIEFVFDMLSIFAVAPVMDFLLSRGEEDFSKINILRGLIPEVLEIMDPPTIVRNKRYKEKLLSTSAILIPDVEMLLRTLAKDRKTLRFSTDNKSKIEKNIASKIIKKSS